MHTRMHGHTCLHAGSLYQAVWLWINVGSSQFGFNPCIIGFIGDLVLHSLSRGPPMHTQATVVYPRHMLRPLKDVVH